MKLYCERCEADGVIGSGFDTICCPSCEGMGYIENNEMERLARIGKATEKWFNPENNYQNQEIDGFFNSVIELLEWAESED